MSKQETFIDAVLHGQATASSIDEWVDAWADNGGAPNGVALSLDDYLGFQPVEGAAWAEEPAMLRFIVIARDQHRPFADVLGDREALAAVARASDANSTSAVLSWLQRRGYLDGEG